MEEQDYVFDNQLNSMSTFGGLFAAKSNDVPFVVDRANLKIETKYGTQQQAPSGPATVIVSKIKNPFQVDTYGPFKISVFDRSRKLIAQVDHDLAKFRTTPGTVAGVNVTATDYFIDEEVRIGV